MQHSPLRDAVIARINELTDTFLETGFFTWSEDRTKEGWYNKRMPLVGHETSVRKYVRKVAAELKRPFVIVDVSTRSNYTPGIGWVPDPNFYASVSIPSVKYTAPLRSALLLVSQPVGRAFRRDKPPVPVGIRHECRRQIFYFYGPQGQHVFDEFMERCKTDKAFRKALKLKD
jgi:hypothetical protein